MADDMTTTASPGPVHAGIIRLDQDLLNGKGKLPSDPHKYVLIDDDAKQCSLIDDDELDASYVDRHVDHYQLDGIETWPQVPNPDNHNVILSYKNGTQTSVSVGSISLDNGMVPDQYYKSQGVIYPIGQSGAVLLNATNTPNLSYIRQHYWDLAAKKTSNDVFMASIVATFAGDVAALAHAGEMSNFLTAEEVTGNVPDPPDSPEDHTDSSNTKEAAAGQDNGN
jgi:hypothetical protein